MGCYHPAVLIKDAQRHGLRVLPVDVTRSQWKCTLENLQLRPGFNYVKGFRKEATESLVRERASRPFASIDDLARRVPALHKDELSLLAEAGALNPLDAQHRRDGLWKSSHAARPAGPLLAELPEVESASPLQKMTIPERLQADFRTTDVNIGKHPMAHHRAQMDALGITKASDLARVPNGKWVKVAGGVIVRQRPGTANGVVFVTLEDESGVSNAVIMPDIFQRDRAVIVGSPWLLVEGPIQNVDGVIHVRARRIMTLPLHTGGVASHDFR